MLYYTILYYYILYYTIIPYHIISCHIIYYGSESVCRPGRKGAEGGPLPLTSPAPQLARTPCLPVWCVYYMCACVYVYIYIYIYICIIYIYTYICTCVYMYIYIERERGRDSLHLSFSLSLSLYIYIYMYIYIYIYIYMTSISHKWHRSDIHAAGPNAAARLARARALARPCRGHPRRSRRRGHVLHECMYELRSRSLLKHACMRARVVAVVAAGEGTAAAS